MKLIIKNDSKETVKNPNVKIIETTEASFINQTVFIEENDVPIIKYTDTEAMYFVKDLDNLYDRKSKSEVLLDITIDNLELIGGGNSEPVDSRPYKVYTALLNQSGTNAPVATVLENTLGVVPTYSYVAGGIFSVSFPYPSDIVYTKLAIILGKLVGEQGGAVYTYDNLGYSGGNIVFNLKTKSNTSTFSNNLLSNTFIEIRVYN